MFRNVGVGVKAVDDIVESCIFGALDRQIGGAASAEDQYVHGNLLFHQRIFAVNTDAGRRDLDACGIAAGEYADQFHIGIAADCLLNASSQISVTENSNSDCHVNVLHKTLYTIILKKNIHVFHLYGKKKLVIGDRSPASSKKKIL